MNIQNKCWNHPKGYVDGCNFCIVHKRSFSHVRRCYKKDSSSSIISQDDIDLAFDIFLSEGGKIKLLAEEKVVYSNEVKLFIRQDSEDLSPYIDLKDFVL